MPNDEICTLLGKIKPDILCVYGTQPCGVPNVKKLVTMIREIGICRDMQILVAGGVFNRADGLCDEIKADLFAPNATDAMKTVNENPERTVRPDVPEPGRRRKRRKNQTLPPMRRVREAVGA